MNSKDFRKFREFPTCTQGFKDSIGSTLTYLTSIRKAPSHNLDVKETKNKDTENKDTKKESFDIKPFLVQLDKVKTAFEVEYKANKTYEEKKAPIRAMEVYSEFLQSLVYFIYHNVLVKYDLELISKSQNRDSKKESRMGKDIFS